MSLLSCVQVSTRTTWFLLAFVTSLCYASQKSLASRQTFKLVKIPYLPASASTKGYWGVPALYQPRTNKVEAPVVLKPVMMMTSQPVIFQAKHRPTRTPMLYGHRIIGGVPAAYRVHPLMVRVGRKYVDSGNNENRLRPQIVMHENRHRPRSVMNENRHRPRSVMNEHRHRPRSVEENGYGSHQQTLVITSSKSSSHCCGGQPWEPIIPSKYSENEDSNEIISETISDHPDETDTIDENPFIPSEYSENEDSHEIISETISDHPDKSDTNEEKPIILSEYSDNEDSHEINSEDSDTVSNHPDESDIDEDKAHRKRTPTHGSFSAQNVRQNFPHLNDLTEDQSGELNHEISNKASSSIPINSPVEEKPTYPEGAQVVDNSSELAEDPRDSAAVVSKSQGLLSPARWSSYRQPVLVSIFSGYLSGHPDGGRSYPDNLNVDLSGQVRLPAGYSANLPGFPLAYPTIPLPSGYPTIPSPSGYPNLPSPPGYPNLPSPSGYPTIPSPSGYPTIPSPSGYPTIPSPSGYPNLPSSPPGYPILPSSSGYTILPSPSVYQNLPSPPGYQTIPTPLGYPSLPPPSSNSAEEAASHQEADAKQQAEDGSNTSSPSLSETASTNSNDDSDEKKSVDSRSISYRQPGRNSDEQDIRPNLPRPGIRELRPEAGGYTNKVDYREYAEHKPGYEFGYRVRAAGGPGYGQGYGDGGRQHDGQQTAEFGHQEARDGDNTKGEYFNDLPDGTRLQVRYYVDGYSGYTARVSYLAGKDGRQQGQVYRP